MLYLNSEISGLLRPLLCLKSDSNLLSIAYAIIYGEFQRNKECSDSNFAPSIDYIDKYWCKSTKNSSSENLSEEEFNDMVKQALEILYGVNNG